MPKPGLALHWKVLIALALGLVVGALVNEFWTSATWARVGVNDPAAFVGFKASEANQDAGATAAAVRFLGKLNKFLGDLFLQLLRFVAVPIVLFSLILAVAGVGDLRKLGRVGAKTIFIFLFTLVIAALIAIAFGEIFSPGQYVSAEARDTLITQYAAQANVSVENAHSFKEQGIWAYLLSIVPLNPFNAIANGQMLQIVAAAFLIGVGLAMIPAQKAAPVLGFCQGIFEAVMQIVRIIISFAPLAVFCLISQFIAGVGLGPLKSVFVFCIAVVVGLGIILFLEYPLLLLLITPRDNRMTPAKFFRGMAPAMTLAFSSSSSSATLPVTIQCARDRLGVPDDIANFVCPMGTTLNMDGTAFYQVTCVLFLAQLYGIDFTFAQYVTVAVMATVVAIGTPGLPSAGIVMMAIVLESVNVPTEGIAIILAVDRLLDMCRTIVNVSGDTVAAIFVAATEKRLGQPLETA